MRVCVFCGSWVVVSITNLQYVSLRRYYNEYVWGEGGGGHSVYVVEGGEGVCARHRVTTPCLPSSPGVNYTLNERKTRECMNSPDDTCDSSFKSSQ